MVVVYYLSLVIYENEPFRPKLFCKSMLQFTKHNTLEHFPNTFHTEDFQPRNSFLSSKSDYFSECYSITECFSFKNCKVWKRNVEFTFTSNIHNITFPSLLYIKTWNICGSIVPPYIVLIQTKKFRKSLTSFGRARVSHNTILSLKYPTIKRVITASIMTARHQLSGVCMCLTLKQRYQIQQSKKLVIWFFSSFSTFGIVWYYINLQKNLIATSKLIFNFSSVSFDMSSFCTFSN